MYSWKKYLLDDVADIKLSNVDKKTNIDERIVRLCNYTDVYKNSFIDAQKAKSFMIASCSESELKNFKLKKGQVAITKDSETRDDIGVSTYISEDFDDVVLGYHTSLITPDESKLNGSFLHYWFNTRQAKRYFENNAGGSGQRCTLPLDIIKSFPLYLPELKTQNKISSFLYALDTKIELNNRINAELESMAKTLYDYWFVQFDFPNAKGKPYKSSGGKMVWNEELKREIPKGWGSVFIEKLLSHEVSTKKIPASEILFKGKIPVIDQSTNYIAGFTNDEDSVIKTIEPRIIFGDHTRILKLINFDFARGADGTQVLLSNSNRMPQHLFYHTLLKIDLSNYGYARHFKFLKGTKIILPNETLANKFDKIVLSNYLMIRENIFQNQILSELRDWLLPMLMNGQIKVK